jgi:carbonic anhydrase
MKTSLWNQIRDPEHNEAGFRCHVGLAQSRENLYPVQSYLFNCSETVPSHSCSEEITWIVLCEPPTLKPQVQSHTSICVG